MDNIVTVAARGQGLTQDDNIKDGDDNIKEDVLTKKRFDDPYVNTPVNTDTFQKLMLPHSVTSIF